MALPILRSSIAALGLASALALTPVSAQAPTPQPAAIDYEAFGALTSDLAEFRASRLLEREAFFARAAAGDAIILDTRSAEAFAAGHIEGAVNLPFSDFTDEKLARVIGEDAGRTILIYCNNNFTDDTFPVALKKAPLALNIPTFINLVGYGYTNVWELDGAYPLAEMPWVSEQPEAS